MNDLEQRLATVRAAEAECRADITAMQEQGERVSCAYMSTAGLLAQQAVSLELAIARDAFRHPQ